MDIDVKYFASVRESVGIAQERVALPPEVVNVGDVRRWLRARGGVWADALAEGRTLRMACNHEMTGPDTRLSPGCEVAFFPPVTGG